ncbi:hypothetical protein K443DRAFT_12284 [Laccaria amethystina LaAM-08-1]|uniref:Uncharacterized protein n=1 Tax=Laccaria amethystina LaAM-08-1 TaxID=1095629 RepID=A0A0C9X986_9AGAR|nr:hypothetical protein K443DRAFT_12284 [Laccaria amethystina LaAM-08-1]
MSDFPATFKHIPILMMMRHATNVPHCLMEVTSCPAQVPCHQPQQGNEPLPARCEATATMRHINGRATSSDSDGVVPSPGATLLPVTWQLDAERRLWVVVRPHRFFKHNTSR